MSTVFKNSMQKPLSMVFLALPLTTLSDCCWAGYCWLPNMNQQRNPSDSKAGFHKIKISLLGHKCVYSYFPEDTTYAGMFRNFSSINYWNLIKIVRSILEKIINLCFGAHLKGSNITDLGQIHSFLYIEYELNPTNHSGTSEAQIHRTIKPDCAI
jgi:hypothetical protein